MAEDRAARKAETERLRLAVECLSLAVDRMLAAEARVEALTYALNILTETAAQYFDTGRGDLDGMVQFARDALAAAPPVPETPK